MPMFRTILNVVLGLIIIGVLLWAVNTYVPMAGSIKDILNIVVVIATCVGVLQAFGLWSRVVGLWSTLMNRVHLSVINIEANGTDSVADFGRHSSHQFGRPHPGVGGLRQVCSAAMRAHRDQSVRIT